MYIRDKRSPVPKSEAVSRVMSANRAKDSKPELLLRRALWSAGLRGYRLHYKIRLPSLIRRGVAAPGDGVVDQTPPQIHPSSLRPHPSSVRPDIAFVGKKVAIFVHGCFWHRCPRCNYPLPKNNTEFWQTKFERNVARDARKKADLKHLGWKVITVWECELKLSEQ